jgi:hypothetical protein
MPGIFISYRREDTPGHAGRIFDRLRSRFGSDVVFMDVTAIEAGVDFVDALRDAVGSCDALLAVIGPQWLSATHDGKRRLDDPADFVRLEIVAALERNVRVLPVLVAGASLPPTESLPADLQKLTRRQAIDLRDARWDDDVERLIEGLDKFLNGGPASRRPAMPREGTPSPTPPVAGAARSSAWSVAGSGMATRLLGVSILVVGAVLVWRGGLSPGRSSDTPTSPSGQTAVVAPSDGPAVTPAGANILSANALFREFQNNAVEAADRYVGQSVTLEGLRGDLILMSDGVQAAVHIADRAKSNALILLFPDRNLLRGTEKGQRFRFRCTVDKYEYAIVWMEDCSVER